MAFPNMSTKNKKTGMTFGQAFKNARKRGATTFTFNGKPYSTKTKDEVSKKNTRAQARAARKKGRVAAKGAKGIKAKMAARKAGRMSARKIKKGNKALRRYS